MKKLLLFLCCACLGFSQTIPAGVGVFNLAGNSGGGGGSGTVTSVSFTGGLISVGTPTTTPAFTVAGTSGGIPYFLSASTWASSGALTANAFIKGGGAGVAPSSSLFSDDGTTATYTGTGGIAITSATTGTLTVNGSTSGKTIYTTANATAQTVTVTTAAQTVGAASATVPDLEGTNRVYVMDTTAQTLTNKRITARLTSITSSATPTVNTDNTDCVNITALAVAITSMTTNLTGTPSDFDQLEYRILDNGTARAITWGASFVAGPTALPTTTTLSKTLHVYFEWDAVRAAWVCISSGSDA